MHEQERDVLQRYYGLTADAIHPIRTVGGGIKAISRITCGADAFVLKRFRTDYRSLDDVIAMHDAQEYLRAAGLPMVAAVPNRDGLTVTDDGPNFAWVLYPWVQGHHIQPGINITVQKAAALGAAVARLGQVLKEWPTGWPGAEPTQLDPVGERIALYEELLRHAERDQTPLGETCRSALKERLRGIRHLAGIAPSIVAMERQWVHGDMNEGNVFFDEWGGIRAIIDFDNIRRSPRGFDFMYALTSFFPTRATEGPERDAYARAWIDAVRPTTEELALLPALWAYRNLCDVWPIDEYYLQPETYPGWEIDPPSDWWEMELERTRDWLLHIG